MEMHVEKLEGDITRNPPRWPDGSCRRHRDRRPVHETAGSDKFLLVDLSKVNFLASMGIRTLITGAKMLKERGGKMILFSPEMMVAKVLKTSGTEMLIPVYYDLGLARNALAAIACAQTLSAGRAHGESVNGRQPQAPRLRLAGLRGAPVFQNSLSELERVGEMAAVVRSRVRSCARGHP